jgi:hypothetical protein
MIFATAAEFERVAVEGARDVERIARA